MNGMEHEGSNAYSNGVRWYWRSISGTVNGRDEGSLVVVVDCGPWHRRNPVRVSPCRATRDCAVISSQPLRRR